LNADIELTEIAKHLEVNGLDTILSYKDGILEKLIIKNYFTMTWPTIDGILDVRGDEVYQKILVVGRLFPMAGESIEKRLLINYSDRDQIDFNDNLLIEGYAQAAFSLDSDRNLMYLWRDDTQCTRQYKNPGDAYLFCLVELEHVLRKKPFLYSCRKVDKVYPLNWMNKK